MTPPDLGKTEAWYIVDADPGAVLYAGLKQGVTHERLREAISTGRVEDCLHRIEPGCAIRAAVAAGTIPAARHDSYLAILAELEALPEAWE